jgi:hypothetical protein
MSLALEEVESCTVKPKSTVAEYGHINPLGQSK